jgi:hypothetical protein
MIETIADRMESGLKRQIEILRLALDDIFTFSFHWAEIYKDPMAKDFRKLKDIAWKALNSEVL